MKKKLKITGTARVSVRPDLTRLDLTLEGTQAEYDRALEESSKQTETLGKLLGKLGFEKSDLKSVGFHVNPNYEDYQEDGLWRRRFQGYRYDHRLKLEFPVDGKLLGKILAQLAASGIGAQIDVRFAVRDTEAVKRELLKQAIADSSKKAKVICEAADVSLGEILSVDYSWETRDYSVGGMNARVLDAQPLRAAKGVCCAVCEEPEDIEIEDSVQVVWSIRS